MLFSKSIVPGQYSTGFGSEVLYRPDEKGGFLTLEEEMTLNQTFTRLVRGVPGVLHLSKTWNFANFAN
jgi:hypothetical protein